MAHAAAAAPAPSSVKLADEMSVTLLLVRESFIAAHCTHELMSSSFRGTCKKKTKKCKKRPIKKICTF